ncbi:hypothetical protein KUTeg_014284 [Tegillarca granosa]|uniref:Uncharacterized protein n=1 Tax=Tegillarca granosa TaxID=220873 RepID=A0ABQ9EW32_TEGGR|nr:hypothetical protein KUTeg_014284 [Tegillarca granosa]
MVRYTANARNTVIEYPIFSPLSAGRTKTNTFRRDKNTTGTRMVIKKKSGFLLRLTITSDEVLVQSTNFMGHIWSSNGKYLIYTSHFVSKTTYGFQCVKLEITNILNNRGFQSDAEELIIRSSRLFLQTR